MNRKAKQAGWTCCDSFWFKYLLINKAEWEKGVRGEFGVVKVQIRRVKRIIRFRKSITITLDVY